MWIDFCAVLQRCGSADNHRWVSKSFESCPKRKLQRAYGRVPENAIFLDYPPGRSFCAREAPNPRPPTEEVAQEDQEKRRSWWRRLLSLEQGKDGQG